MPRKTEPAKPIDDARINDRGTMVDPQFEALRINPAPKPPPSRPGSRICANCGRLFLAPPTSKKVTCSSACSCRRKVGTHVGVSNTWSAEARERLSARGQTDNLKLGTPAAQASLLAGPYETNQEAKRWWIVTPDGDVHEVVNLRKWLRDNAHMLPGGRDDLAYAGLRQVQLSMMGLTKRPVGAWKGWTLKKPAEQK